MSDSDTKHPDSNFKASYPYNQATITRSGHEIHVNDTPGNESLKISHTKGTYIEIDSFGRWTQVCVDTAYNYYKSGLSEAIDGNKDIKVVGSLNQNIDGSIGDSTAGNRYVATGGDLKHGIAGSEYHQVQGTRYVKVNGDKVEDVSGDDHKNISGDQVLHVGGAKLEIIGGPYTVSNGLNNIEVSTQNTLRLHGTTIILDAVNIILIAGASITSTAGGDVSSSAGGIVSMLAGGDASMTAGGLASVTAGGDASIKGAVTSVLGDTVDVTALTLIQQTAPIIKLN